MSGYRDRSGFDPMAGGSYGPAKRPYNWVQWLGVASLVVGVGILLAYLGGRAGLFPEEFDNPTPGTAFVLIALPLINSRREPGALSPETRRQRLIIIAAALLVCAITAALVIYFKGA